MEVLGIYEELQKLEKMTLAAIRKQLEDEAHAKDYESIIQENDQRKLTLEKRKTDLEGELKDMKILDEMKDTIRKLAKIYQEEYRTFSLEKSGVYTDSSAESGNDDGGSEGGL